MCGNIILSGICANTFSPWGCSLKNESSSSSNPNSSSSSGSGSGSGSIYDYNSNSDPNPNPNSDPNPNPTPNLIPNPNLNPSSKVLNRCCIKCNFIKTLNNFDEDKYTCRNCTSAKVSCPYCASVVRYDGIRAHVKKQHPTVELTRGFSRNLGSSYTDLGEKTINTRAVSPLVIRQTGDL